MTHCRCSAPTLRRELLAESIPDTHHTTFTFSTRSHTDMCHARHVEHSDDMPSMAPITCIYRITVSIHAVLSQTQTTRQRLQIARLSAASADMVMPAAGCCCPACASAQTYPFSAFCFLSAGACANGSGALLPPALICHRAASACRCCPNRCGNRGLFLRNCIFFRK